MTRENKKSLAFHNDIRCHQMTSDEDVMRCDIMTSYVRKYIEICFWNQQYIYITLSIFWTKSETVVLKKKKVPPWDLGPFSVICSKICGQESCFLNSYRLIVCTSLLVFVTILLPLKGLKQLNKNCIPSPYPMFYDLL